MPDYIQATLQHEIVAYGVPGRHPSLEEWHVTAVARDGAKFLVEYAVFRGHRAEERAREAYECYPENARKKR